MGFIGVLGGFYSFPSEGESFSEAHKLIFIVIAKNEKKKRGQSTIEFRRDYPIFLK